MHFVYLCLKSGLFGSRTLLQRLLLLPCILESLPCLAELSFQFTPAPADLGGLAFGAFTPPCLLPQGFGQPRYLLLHFGLSCLQLLRPRFERGFASAGTLFPLGLQLLARLLQIMPQLRLSLFVLGQFRFQLAASLSILGSFDLSL